MFVNWGREDNMVALLRDMRSASDDVANRQPSPGKDSLEPTLEPTCDRASYLKPHSQTQTSHKFIERCKTINKYGII
jgi:hypothetical protein